MFPDYFNRPCPVCGRVHCSSKHDYYYRPAFTEDGESLISDLQVIRYICRAKNKPFSLLPSQLIPYRRYAIATATRIVKTWTDFKCRISETMINLFRSEPVAEELLNIESPGVYSIINLFKNSLHKYNIWKNERIYLEEFVSLCAGNDCYNSEIVADDYYLFNGGYKHNSHFLFGKASQFRQLRP